MKRENDCLFFTILLLNKHIQEHTGHLKWFLLSNCFSRSIFCYATLEFYYKCLIKLCFVGYYADCISMAGSLTLDYIVHHRLLLTDNCLLKARIIPFLTKFIYLVLPWHRSQVSRGIGWGFDTICKPIKVKQYNWWGENRIFYFLQLPNPKVKSVIPAHTSVKISRRDLRPIKNHMVFPVNVCIPTVKNKMKHIE